VEDGSGISSKVAGELVALLLLRCFLVVPVQVVSALRDLFLDLEAGVLLRLRTCEAGMLVVAFGPKDEVLLKVFGSATDINQLTDSLSVCQSPCRCQAPQGHA
jgi:hypothetical protein